MKSPTGKTRAIITAEPKDMTKLFLSAGTWLATLPHTYKKAAKLRAERIPSKTPSLGMSLKSAPRILTANKEPAKSKSAASNFSFVGLTRSIISSARIPIQVYWNKSTIEIEVSKYCKELQ